MRRVLAHWSLRVARDMDGTAWVHVGDIDNAVDRRCYLDIRTAIELAEGEVSR